MRSYWVYILASKYNGTLYIGVTGDIVQRVYAHRIKFDPKCFTAQYDVTKLVYAEECNDIEAAIYREKRLKRWNRQWKINLIESVNPNWDDLYETVI